MEGKQHLCRLCLFLIVIGMMPLLIGSGYASNLTQAENSNDNGVLTNPDWENRLPAGDLLEVSEAWAMEHYKRFKISEQSSVTLKIEAISSSADTGLIPVRLRAVIRGVPVIGKAIILYIDEETRDVLWVDGSFGEEDRADLSPTINKEDAISSLATHGVDLSHIVKEPELVLYTKKGKEPRLAWRTEVSLSDLVTTVIYAIYFVDAHTGELFAESSNIMDEQGRSPAANGNWSLEEALYDVQEMYVAYYGRPADPPGLEYWSHCLEGENGLATILDAFGNSREFTKNYGTLPPTELVNGLYNQMFGRDAEAGGLAFYTNRLENGAAGLAVIAKQIADGAQGEDAIILANRVKVANEFTESIKDRFSIDLYGPERISNAQGLMSLVTSDIDSLAVAYEALDALVAERCPSCNIRAEAIELAGPNFVTCGETVGQGSVEIPGLSSYDEVNACMVNAIATRQPFVAYLLVDGSADLVERAVAFSGESAQLLVRYPQCPFSDYFCQGTYLELNCSGSWDDLFAVCEPPD